MATVSMPLDPTSGMFRSSAFPQVVQANGSNYPIRGLAFDASTEESVFFRFPIARYGSGNVSVEFRWYADTASSGNVVWGAQLAAVTPDADTQDVETDGLATAATATDSHLGTTGQRLHAVTVTITSLDSLANSDDVTLRLYRAAADGSDTMTGDAIVVAFLVSWSDT